jgi:hypothetical protein
MSREIDALVAEKVMGYVSGDWQDSFHGKVSHFKWRDPEKKMLYRENDLPHFSTNIAAAWQLLEKVAQGRECEMIVIKSSTHTSDYYQCQIQMADDTMVRTATTAPMAICLATLEFAGVEAHE